MTGPKTGGRSLLINAVTGQVGTGTKMSGNPTNQELAAPTHTGRDEMAEGNQDALLLG